MIRKIYSKIDHSMLLHVVYVHEADKEDIEKKINQAVSEPEHFLQVAAFKMPLDATVKPHAHNPQKRQTDATHEALLVFKGSIELSVYDTDKRLVETLVLNEGDCYVILNGGHGIKALTPARLFEFKNGPYNGPEKDRTYF